MTKTNILNELVDFDVESISYVHFASDDMKIGFNDSDNDLLVFNGTYGDQFAMNAADATDALVCELDDIAKECDLFFSIPDVREDAINMGIITVNEFNGEVFVASDKLDGCESSLSEVLAVAA